MSKNSPQDIKNREIFSQNLNRIMKNKGVRQIDLHNNLGIPKSTITGYVKGYSMPTLGNIQKIADYLNVKKSDLDPRFSANSSALKTDTEPIPIEDLKNRFMTFDGKPLTEDDLKAIQTIIEVYLGKQGGD
ncbi:transcriptional regulator [Streptococcus gallolyticus subsp. gallolyticus]|uniref:Phage transcriptional regulator n=2 Tax=Streptococcus gallolyticus TaxID=315405 RepID=A0AA36JZI4_STRG3|nr:helix-turn-helix transcriptional regulator [Streptococcus gallolyticus]MCF2566957.1 helix-turn-helix transcriptional regulator [Streptococcus pasteurianus]KJE98797.1 transcriptional regulator [Streptococcus gallolyticus subsp. gallolyticus]MCF1634563.1 helix-turn-helix domain-containing protein [Streptococcus gallolyticus]MCY7152751.1 helix-turn-helix domain-containing protein [Streptococcus gallolyticus subsp. gallolyticus]MCY7156120.1 helix-turn-helix domain-containing protein [Streptococ